MPSRRRASRADDAGRSPSDAFLPFRHGKAPVRIELLELDIDLRLADLWREAGEIQEWYLEVVAAFMRAAYGKGYCDALTEDAPARCASSTATACRRAAPASLLAPTRHGG